MIRTFITELNADIKQKANEIAASIENDTNSLYYVVPQSVPITSPSYKKWILLGSGGAAVGILGILFSDSVKSWQVILTAMGAILAGYGATQDSKRLPNNTEMDYTSIKNFYIDKVETALNKASETWDQFINSKNESLANKIKQLISDEKLQSKALFKTYYRESIKVSLIDFMSALNNIPIGDNYLNACLSVKNDFVSSIKSAIYEAAENQTKQYSEIIELLDSSEKQQQN